MIGISIVLERDRRNGNGYVSRGIEKKPFGLRLFGRTQRMHQIRGDERLIRVPHRAIELVGALLRTCSGHKAQS
jgi:hypothetical protein